jgi:DNA polymerase-3 subunit gamma/tau
MAYVSLYRKYRPQTFEDVVGQDHVTTTLRNAIAEGRVASGYLFTGTRGTAKTTCARILAKALNCIGPDGTRAAPTPEPCGVCGPCQSIAASNFVDVLEMDAASHGKVDDVRDLVASIKFPPMEGRYKVYIIDEAHQLSRDAMDAFLKTLEEPPDRVVFVLATTELEKLPITIASRCQVFEFKRGSVAQIASRLSLVLQTEGVKADPPAVTLIARAADGSYRDSLSLLEQVLAYKRTGITVRDTTTVLGTIDEDVLTRVVALISACDAAGAFTIAADILESGKDVRQFLKSLSGRLRDMLFVGVGAQPSGAGEMDDTVDLRRQAASFSPAALLQCLQILTEAEQETKRSNQHRLLLEMTLLRLMRLPTAPSIGIGQPSPTAVESRTAKPADVGTQSIKSTPQVPPASITVTEPPIVTTPDPIVEGPQRSGEEGLPPPIDDDELPDSDMAEDDEMSDLDVLVPGDDELDTLPLMEDDAVPALEFVSQGPSLLVTTPDEHDAADDFMQVQQVAVPEAPAPTNENGHRVVISEDASEELIQLQKKWQEVINRMSSRAPQGVDLVRNAHPVSLVGHTVTLEVATPFDVDRLGSERRRKVIEEIIDKTLGAENGTYRVKAIIKGTALPAKVAISPAPRVRETVSAPAPQHSAFLDEVIAVFGGQVLDDDTKG